MLCATAMQHSGRVTTLTSDVEDIRLQLGSAEPAPPSARYSEATEKDWPAFLPTPPPVMQPRAPPAKRCARRGSRSARVIDDVVEVLHGELFGVAAAFDRRFGAVEPPPVELDAGQESLTGVVSVVTAEG